MSLMFDHDIVEYGANSKRIYNSGSSRTQDGNDFLIITDCILTKEAVNEYSGRQIADYKELGLEPDKMYSIYRPLEEIKKAKYSYNLKPLTDDHIAISPENPNTDKTLGTSGESCVIEEGNLFNTIAVWVGKGLQYIEDADRGLECGKKDLSCGYAYELIPEEGEWGGKKYQFRMVNLRCNHVALVKEGRVAGASIADSAEVNIKTGVQIVKKRSGIKVFLDHFFKDSEEINEAEKIRENKEILKTIKEIAKRDATEFEGGDAEKAKILMEIATKLHDLEPDAESEPEIEDEEDDEKKDKLKDKKAKDMGEGIAQIANKSINEKNKEAVLDEDEDPKEKVKEKAKEKMMDSMAMDELISRRVNETIKARDNVIKLCTRAVGALSDDLIMDSNLENIVNNTLRLKNLSYEGKSLETKLSMLDVLASQNNSGIKMFKDSNLSNHENTLNVKLINLMGGK